MIVRPTVLVLGAGASRPYGFPTGLSLVGETVRALMSPDSERRQLLKACGFSGTDQESFAGALAGSARNSIDAFLEGRAEYRPIGTAAIAAALMPLESWFALHSVGDEEDWYRYLWNAIGNRAEDVHTNKLTIVTFNYDRSLEYFFLNAARDSWGLSTEDAAKLLRPIEIIHLHGQIGMLPSLGAKGALERSFTSEVDPKTVMAAAGSIKIVHDDIDADPDFERAREILNAVEVICFLGFGYGRPNVRRLFGGTKIGPRLLIGSAKDIKYGERRTITQMFRHDRIILLPETLGCLSVLREAPVLNWQDYIDETKDFSGGDLAARLRAY